MQYGEIEKIKQKSFKQEESVFYTNEPNSKDLIIEKLYLNVRMKEGRIYDDETVKRLPQIESSHKYYHEWQIRKLSSRKLCNRIAGNKIPKTILEIGCGNGWLAAMLAKVGNGTVFGMDINRKELEQGARVFSDLKNLIFIYGNIFVNAIDELRFDYIILASSVSYFENIDLLTRRLYSLLNEGGEIHFIDNPSYIANEIKSAKERSKEYYNRLGVPEMSEYYYHHDIFHHLKNYNCEILYDPDSFTNRVKRKLQKSFSPFHWIVVMK